MVDDFEKKYNALDIPYPKDTSQAEIAAEDAKQKMAYDKFVAQSATRADGVKAELAKVIIFLIVNDFKIWNKFSWRGQKR